MITTDNTKAQMNTTLARSIAMRTLRLLMLLLAPLLALPASAAAGTYTVDSCQHPDGAFAGTAGWAPFYQGAYMYYSDDCRGGGSLNASMEPTLEHAYQDVALWSFASPPGTSLKRFAAARSARAGMDRANGSPDVFIRADADYIERCAAPYGCTTLEGAIDAPLTGQQRVEYGVSCGGGPGGRCPAGSTFIALKGIRIVLNDNASPTFSNAPNGPLTSPTSTARVRAVNYSAKDVGGGIFRQRLLADGKEVAAGPVDDNEGQCKRYPVGNGFSSPVPCSTATSGSLSYDTAGLSDGAHELELQIFDATNENKIVSSWPIQVDNGPPSVGDVEVGGVARENDELRCSATFDGQSARVSYQWLRATADGSDVTEIAGATGASVTVTAADVARKLLCRVTVTDGGGSSTKTSTITTGPFAGGAVVVAKEAAAVSGGGAPLGSLAALPVCTRSKATLFGMGTKIVRSYNRSGLTLSGRLTATSGGARLSGATLEVLQTVTRAGVSKRTKVATVKTGSSGSFRVKVPSGPTRLVQLVETGCGSVGPTVTERVRGAVGAKTTTSRVRNRQTARFRGRVLGGYVGRGLPLELQVKVGSKWKDVKAVTTNARGEYRVSYRFMRTLVRYTYRFRMVTRASGAWPYMAAKSREVKVRVN